MDNEGQLTFRYKRVHRDLVHELAGVVVQVVRDELVRGLHEDVEVLFRGVCEQVSRTGVISSNNEPSDQFHVPRAAAPPLLFAASITATPLPKEPAVDAVRPDWSWRRGRRSRGRSRRDRRWRGRGPRSPRRTPNCRQQRRAPGSLRTPSHTLPAPATPRRTRRTAVSHLLESPLHILIMFHQPSVSTADKNMPVVHTISTPQVSQGRIATWNARVGLGYIARLATYSCRSILSIM